MKKWKRVTFRVVIGIPIVLILLVTGLVGAFLALNSMGRINGVASYFMNHYVNGKMEFDSLHFDFTKLPEITVNVSNGLLISALPGYEKDTLCYFSHLTCTINPFRISGENLIDIPYVYLTDPYAQVTLNKEGRPNWAIWKFKKSPAPGSLVVSTPKKPIKLNIAKVRIYGFPKFHYENHHTGMQLDAHADSLLFDGRIAIDYKKLNASYLKVPNLRFRMHVPVSGLYISSIADTLYLNRTQQQGVDYYKLNIRTRQDTLYIKGKDIFEGDNFRIRGGAFAGADYKLLGCTNLRIDLEGTALLINGMMKKEPGRHAMDSDLTLQLRSRDAGELLQQLPLPEIPLLEKMRYTLPLSVTALAQGRLWPAASVYPDLEVRLNIREGSLKYLSYPSLKGIRLKLLAHIRPDTALMASARISTLSFRFLHSNFQMRGDLNDFPRDPRLTLGATSRIELGDLSHFVKGDSMPLISGTSRMKLNFDLPLSVLKNRDLRLISGDLKMVLTDFAAELPKQKIRGTVDTLRLELPHLLQPLSSTRDSVEALVTGDSLYFSLSERIEMSMGRIALKGGALLQPLTSRRNPQRAAFELVTDGGVFRYDSSEMALDHAGAILSASRRPDNNSEFKDSSMVKRILNGWEVRGAVVLENAHLLTPYLPLDNYIEQLAVSFTPQRVNLREASFRSGGSALQIQGSVNNWEEYVLRGEELSADFNILSDSIKLSELIPSLASGVLSQTRGKNDATDSLAKRIFPPNFIPPAEATKRSKERLIVIPQNLNVRISLDAKNVDYEKILLDGARGNIILADRALLIDKMRFTSGVGNIDLSASYKTPSLYEASTDLTLRISDLNVNSVLRMIPDLPTLVPMLTTLEGKLGCSITAEAKLDSAMYVEIPTLYSVAQVRGEHLSIEKDKVMPRCLGRLLFGKKKEIELDSIRVDLIVKDSILSVYPFVVDVGRYRILAEGVQHLDQTFFYHLTLLKWPLWVKLGFNVYGRPHDIHFRLACPKLMNLSLPAKVLSVKETRLYPALNVQNALNVNMLRQRASYQKLFQNYKNRNLVEQKQGEEKPDPELINRLRELMRQE